MSDGNRFYESLTTGVRRSAPAALRNREPIGDVLEQWLPLSGLVLEIASGTGEHAVYFAERFPELEWQPSDIHPDALASIAARRADSAVPNLREPLMLDASDPNWKAGDADAVLSINMVHISPWTSALGLLEGARRVLPQGGPLILCGPWIEGGLSTAPSNLAFDANLRARNPQWGLRSIEEFTVEGELRGLRLAEVRPMPANNRMLLLRRC